MNPSSSTWETAMAQDTQSRNKGSDQFHRAATVCLMLTSMGVIMGLTTPGMADTDLGVVSSSVHLPIVLTTIAVYALVLSPLLTQPKTMLQAVRPLAWFVPLLVYCVLSGLWSSHPSLSFRRSLFLLLTTLIGVVLGWKYTYRDLARMWGLASAIHLGLVAVFMVIAPNMVYSFEGGHALRGLTTHKNVFGLETGLAFLVFAFVPFRRLSLLRWPLMALAGTMLLLSRSAGSLVSTVAALAVVPLLFPMRYRGAQRIALSLVTGTLGAVAAVLLVTNLQLLPQLLSKNATLTGRTDLWALVQEAIAQRPLLGYGFDSFWTGLEGDSLTIIRSVGWLVPTAHNGYLDLLLGIGYVGALLFVPLVLQYGSRALQSVARERGSERYLPAAFLVFWLVYNLNESALLTRSGLPFLLFTASSIAIAKARPARSVRRAAAVSYPAPMLVS